MKTCSSCKEPKTYLGFHKDPRKKDGFSYVCKVCAGVHARKSRFKRVYGITIADYDQMLEAQGSRCKCCNLHADDQTKMMAVDHCHSTGKVRGLLCGLCNRGIGALGDTLEGVQKAVKYLEDNG